MPINRAQWTHPDLQSLVQLFFESPDTLGQFAEIAPEDLPDPQRKLLAHTSHMTVTMEEHHGCPVNVKVLEPLSTSNHYARKSLLTRQTDGVVVQFGIVRLSKNSLAESVRKQIEGEQIPLGRVLIDSQVLRTVKLMSTWKIKPGDALKKAFQDQSMKVCYGRTALIYTDGIPAVELLEIVGNV